jgi:hypothetical protein
MLEWELGHDEPWHVCPRPPPLFIAQRDGGPQPWIGWCPRSGHEVKVRAGHGFVLLGARWGQSNILPLDLNLKY